MPGSSLLLKIIFKTEMMIYLTRSDKPSNNISFYKVLYDH